MIESNSRWMNEPQPGNSIQPILEESRLAGCEDRLLVVVGIEQDRASCRRFL